MLVLILRLVLFAVTFCGAGCLLNRFTKLPAAMIPAMLCCSMGCLLQIGGILNVLRFLPPAFVLLGLYGFVYELWKGARFRWLKDPMMLVYLAVCAYFFAYFYGHYITAGDDYNNWAIVVRVMLRYDRLPRFTDTVIIFPSYPTGSAGWVYLVCKILGSDSGGTMLFAQTFLMLSCVLPLAALTKRRKAAAGVVILLMALIGLTMNEGSSIQSLYVDALLPLVCLSGVALGFCCRDSLQEKWYLLLPAACFLAVIKGSGLFFSAVLAAEAAMLLRGCPNKRKRRLTVLGLIGIPLCLLFLWNRHADLVFEGGLMTRHSTSLRYFLHQAMDKGGAGFAETLQSFSAQLIDFAKMRSTYAVFGLLLCAAFVGRRTKADAGYSGGALLLTSAIVYVVYLLGLLGMYLFSMPEDTAEAFNRYTNTVLILIVGFAAVYLILLFNELPERTGEARLRTAAACVLLTAFCFVVRLPVRTLVRYPVEQEENIKALTACMPEHDKETRYLVYIWDGHKEQNYGHRMVHYAAYPAQSDIISADAEDIPLLDSWTQQYDYLIAFWTDDNYLAYAEAHGLDPDVQLWTPQAYAAAWRPAGSAR